MSNSIREEVKKLPNLFIYLKAKWTALITLGVNDNMSTWQQKRVRLLNGICAMGVIAQTWFVITYTAPEERWVFIEALQAAIFYTIPIWLNYLHKPKVAAHLFCIYNMIIYSWFAISHGEADGAEYFLLPSGMSAMLFFRRSWIIYTYFILNLGLFWLCKYLFSVMEPLIVLPFNTYPSNLTILFIVSFLIVYYFKTENERQEKMLVIQNKHLGKEQKKSDKLLLNILPYETALELKATGAAKAKYYPEATVMFTDFKNFTHLSEIMHPEELVAEINFYFSAFDNIIAKYNIEKIKTIGDSYMCASGLPDPDKDHATNMVKAAMEIVQFMQMTFEEKLAVNNLPLQIRIGINSGPIVAGIVGTTKFAYDIWGDTVNIASRMETAGEPGFINISEATYLLVKHRFVCTPRGKLNAKNKGMLDMYKVVSEFPGTETYILNQPRELNH